MPEGVWCNKNVLRRFLKAVSDAALVMSAGRLFHEVGAATLHYASQSSKNLKNLPVHIPCPCRFCRCHAKLVAITISNSIMTCNQLFLPGMVPLQLAVSRPLSCFPGTIALRCDKMQ